MHGALQLDERNLWKHSIPDISRVKIVQGITSLLLFLTKLVNEDLLFYLEGCRERSTAHQYLFTV